MKRILLFAVAAIALACMLPGSASAQATRTWISGVGDDANPCSRTAPCKTFAGAISKTATGGEIDCLDPGGFGGATITKSITFDCSSVIGGVLVSGTNGITINAAGGNVILRGLDINGVAGTGLAGISVVSANSVLIQNDKIYGFGAQSAGAAVPAINIVPTCSSATNVKIDITDTTVSNNLGGGILIAPGSNCTATASLSRVNILTSGAYGMRVQDNSKATVFQSVSSNNTSNGFLAESSSAAVEIDLIDSVAANNGQNGVVTSGNLATINLSRDSLINNATNIRTSSGGTIAGSTPATTLNAGSASPGAPNGTANGLQ